jgi:PAS domain S-box-containing protein
MNEFRDLPGAARRLIIGTAVAGLAAVAFRLPQLFHWNKWDVITWLSLTVGSSIAEQFSVAVHHHTETENFSLTDAIWVPALLFARPSVLTLAVVAGTLLGHWARHWAWFKIVYNVSQFVLAITAAELVYGLFNLTGDLQLLSWLAAAMAMLSYFVLNETFIATIIALVEGERLRKVLVLPAGLNFVHAAGNVTIGMLAALVWSTGPLGLPLLVAPIVLSYLAYRGWVQSKREEEQTRDRQRMQALYEAGRALFGPLDVKFDFQPFLQLVRKMVDAVGVELVIVDDDVRVYSSEMGLFLTTEPDGRAHAPERYVSTRPGMSTYLARISGSQDIHGVLAVHRNVALTPAEGSLVEALASQVYVKQENERLFQETVQQRSHLADVIGNTSDGIFVVSQDRQILSWNPAMERITGFSRSDAVGERCDGTLRVRLEHERSEGGTIGSLELESPETQDALLIRKDGTDRWIRYTSNAMPDREGRTRAFVVVARDVTAELEAERMKGDFVATVSHELRTPLTPLKGFLMSLDQGMVEDSPASRHEYYGIMLRQAERLERLINDLLDVSRIDSGKLAMEPMIIPLAEFLVEQIQEAERHPIARPVTFHRPDEAVWVSADPFRVGQIVSNLLSNAFKYSPANTPIEMRLVVADGRAVVSVRNEGEGMSLNDRERVFDRFYRGESGLTRKTGGVGLGLYISKRLVEAMGGQLALESSLGRGCTFSFDLPMTAAPSGLIPAWSIGTLAAAGS